MVTKLLLSGLIAIPFYELFVYLLLPTGQLPQWIDFRQTKEYIAVGLALALTAAVWRKIKISCPNVWALLFLVFLWLNFSKTPIAVANPIFDLSLLGKFSCEFKVFSFFLMFCSLSSIQLNVDRILKVILSCSVLMAIYMILQMFHVEQIFKTKPEYLNSGFNNMTRVAGTFGQPTLAVPFIVMSIPIAVYFKKWFSVLALSIAAIFTWSAFAVGSLVLFVGLYAVKTRRKSLCISTIVLMVACVIGYFLKPDGLFNDNSRFFVWQMILKDVFLGVGGVKFSMFGAGLNNYGEIFSALHMSAYTFAHNEYLQVLWGGGVFGLALFLIIHFDVFKTAWMNRGDERIVTIVFSLIGICFCAFGTFVWQLGVYDFYTVVLVSLIYQRHKRKQHDINTVN